MASRCLRANISGFWCWECTQAFFTKCTRGANGLFQTRSLVTLVFNNVRHASRIQTRRVFRCFDFFFSFGFYHRLFLFFTIKAFGYCALLFMLNLGGSTTKYTFRHVVVGAFWEGFPFLCVFFCSTSCFALLTPVDTESERKVWRAVTAKTLCKRCG